MSAASIETMLELWAAELRAAKARLRPLFTQERVAASAGWFLDGLLGPERRQTGWMRAEAAGELAQGSARVSGWNGKRGDPGLWRQQAILGRGRWEADALRDIVRDYVLETLADADAVLASDATGFLKQGKASCGAGRQYTGSAGKITNCQIGVFAACASRHGHAFIDRALSLPKSWTDDPARLKAAHVPAQVGFATKPQLAGRMIARAIAASWHGWHRHVSLVMPAFAMRARIRHHANQPTPPKTLLRTARKGQVRQTSSAGRSRRSAASPSAAHNDASGPHTSSPGRSGDAPIRPPHNAHT